MRARLRAYAAGRERLLTALRMLRYGMLQGPWQGWLVRHHQRRALNPPLPCGETSYANLDVRSSVQHLLTRGWGGAFVAPESLVREIVDYACTLRERGIKRHDDPHLHCDAAHRLAHDPRIVAVAREFLGAEPILCASNLYWTIPPAGDVEGQRAAAAEGGRFHYDMIDVRALTVFVYLSDVDETCGPHVVIEGTQGPKRAFRKFDRFLSDHEVVRRYADRIHVITGPRGTGWCEDITCYHRQQSARNERLMISINYSLHRPPLARERLALAQTDPDLAMAEARAL
jgi:hypothetical protein